jgi:hypothetical protein
MNKKDWGLTKKKNGLLIVFSLAITLVIMFCCLGVPLSAIISNPMEYPVPNVDINVQDPFIKEREEEFHLSTVIPKYDQVITAIENFHQDRGSYPKELIDLVPQYLSKQPGIYLNSGEYLQYSPEAFQEGTPPFTFMVRGHYPFPAFMHGWDLVYCPETYLGCAPGGDRHIYTFKVNSRWIWIHGSAL